MAPVKPTIVLVPGAWHPAYLYSGFLTRLHRQGYPAVTVQCLSLMGSTPSNTGCQEDAKFVREQLFSLIEDDGQDVVILCHSYGGIYGGGAARGLSKASRKREGKRGGVIGLIYMTAFVVPEGQSLIGTLGGNNAPFVIENQPVPGLSMVDDPRKVFYADVDSTIASRLAKLLLPQPLVSGSSPAPSPAWSEHELEGRIAYLKCAQDKAIPLFLQDHFTKSSGVDWIIKHIEASHSPWVSRPDETARIMLDWAERFAATY